MTVTDGFSTDWIASSISSLIADGHIKRPSRRCMPQIRVFSQDSGTTDLFSNRNLSGMPQRREKCQTAGLPLDNLQYGVGTSGTSR